MPTLETALYDGGLLACGALTLHEGLADRRPFVLPGDRPVWGRDRPLRVSHERLEFSFDLARGEVRGVATATFQPRVGDLREAVFDAIELDIASVTDENGAALPFSAGGGKLRIDLGTPRPADEAITIVVRYSCHPRRGL